MTDDIQVWMKVAAFVGGGMAMGFGAIGAAIGEGYTASKANEAIARNPQLSGDLFQNHAGGSGHCGNCIDFCADYRHAAPVFPSFSVISSSDDRNLSRSRIMHGTRCYSGPGSDRDCPRLRHVSALKGSRGMKNRITTIMLAGSAIAQSPAIFALVTSLILLFIDFFRQASVTHLGGNPWRRPGFPVWGAIGSGIGEGLVAKSGCEGIARQPLGATRVTNVMLLGNGRYRDNGYLWIINRLYSDFLKAFRRLNPLPHPWPLLGAGLCMGIGAIGPGIGEGFAGQSAVKWIARNEEGTATLTRSMLVGQAVAESTGIYALVISLILIFCGITIGTWENRH